MANAAWVWTIASTTSQSGLNTWLGTWNCCWFCSWTLSISPVLSVANTPVIRILLQHHSKRRRNRHTMLSIPCPSARKDLGSWPSTGPAPWASRVPSSALRTHQNVPSNAIAEPSLHALNDEFSSSSTMLNGFIWKCILSSSWASQWSRREQ